MVITPVPYIETYVYRYHLIRKPEIKGTGVKASLMAITPVPYIETYVYRYSWTKKPEIKGTGVKADYFEQPACHYLEQLTPVPSVSNPHPTT